MAGPMVLYSEWFLCIPYVLVMLILKHAILRITQLVQDSGWLLFLGALTLDRQVLSFFPKTQRPRKEKISVAPSDVGTSLDDNTYSR